jgi:hypothetical protein
MSTKLEEITKLLDGLQSALNQSAGNSFGEVFVFMPLTGRRPSKDELKAMLVSYGIAADEVLASFHRSPEGREDVLLVATPGNSKKIEGWKWYQTKGLANEVSLYRVSESLNAHFAQWRAE